MRKLINFKVGRCKDIGFPERVICKSEKEFYDTINKYNGIREKIYFSLYDCDENRNFDEAEIHVIGLDLDSEKSLDNLIKLWEYCKKNNYKSLYTFSTKGFWCYVFTKNHKRLKNKCSALRLATEHIAKEIGLTIGLEKDNDLDGHVVGDVKRITRLPNSFDIKRKRYCIPITIEDMRKGYEWIVEKSKKQHFTYSYYNRDYFSINIFDRPAEEKVNLAELKTEIKVDDKVIDNFLPCVKNCIANIPLKSHNQFWVWTTIYMKEISLNENAIKKLVKPFLEKHKRSDGKGENDWVHYLTFDHLPESVVRSSYSMPCCDKLMKAGYCPGRCKKYAGNNFPIYR